MDSLKVPKKELQGPRPPALKVGRTSHKIKKPPQPLPPHEPPPPPYPQPRQPVIIYTVSPKTIHTSPSKFMDLVQRLTGPAHAGAAPLASPAASFVDVEPQLATQCVDNAASFDAVWSPGLRGILSPNPTSLPPFASQIFEDGGDPTMHNFFQDLSPFMHRQFGQGELPFFISPHGAASPIDLFNNFTGFYSP